MPESESLARKRSGMVLPGWLAVCVLTVLSAGCVATACWDCNVCASSLMNVGCVSVQEPQASGDATWFDGARLIDGNGGAPIETSAFLVEDGVFAWVGRQGEREAPAGAERVNLSGKTVIPALIDAHQHIGLTNVKDGTHSKDNYTLSNLVEHLERSAYHGVAATMSLGLEFDEALAFELRNETFADAARFLTSGRGIAATPLAGPQQEYRLGIPRGARTEAAGRAAVAELDGQGVDIIKIWVDDRGGTVPKLVREHPDVWTIPNLPGSPVMLDDLPWLGETLPPFEIENLRAQAERVEAEGPGAFFELQCRNLARNREAGMSIGMGTDSGVSVAWTTHTEIRDMAGCGLTPMEAI